MVHPKTLYLPKIGGFSNGPLYALSLAPYFNQLKKENYDVILGSWAYPDGVGAWALSKFLDIPCAIKVHGSDLNFISKDWAPKKYLEHVFKRTDAIVAVSRPLAREAEKLGAPKENIHFVKNGVNQKLFRCRSKPRSRKKIGLPKDKKIIVYVGNLKKTKGILDLLEAFDELKRTQNNVELYLVGDGPLKNVCQQKATTNTSLHVMGSRGIEDIPYWMNAADVLTLPSWAEGTPNVIIEAGASGCPVVATDVGGIPDLIQSAKLGVLCPPKSPNKLAKALYKALNETYIKEDIKKLSGSVSWHQSALQLHKVLKQIA